MVWASVRLTDDRLLTTIKNKVNSDEYIKILEDHVIDFFISMNSSNKTTPQTMQNQKFWENGVTLLENWPAQSPDPNIIENL